MDAASPWRGVPGRSCSGDAGRCDGEVDGEASEYDSETVGLLDDAVDSLGDGGTSLDGVE